MRTLSLTLTLAAVTALLMGCREKEEIRVYRVERDDDATPALPADPHAGLPAGAPTGAQLPAGHPPMQPPNQIRGNTPAEWKAGKPSSMRQASFLVEGAAAAVADISLVILPGSAGGPLENVNRWRGQLGQEPFDQPGLEQSAVRIPAAAGEALVVDIEGLAEGADPLTDGRMIAAIITRPGDTWFFKMRGNATLVAAQKQGFLDWLASVTLAEAVPPPPAQPEAAADPTQPTWQVPAGWVEAAPKPMRVVTYTVTGPGDDAGEVTVVMLSGDGGGTLANLNRWRGQIGLDPVGEEVLATTIRPLRAGANDLSMVDLAGPESHTLTAWTTHAGRTWFFKLSGSAAVVAAERERFSTFLNSIVFPAE